MADDLPQQFARLSTQPARSAQEQSWLSEGLATAQPQQPPSQPQPIVRTPRMTLEQNGTRSDLIVQPIPETPHEEAAALAASEGRPSADEHTPAIRIPSVRGVTSEGAAFDGTMHEPEYFDRSTLENYMSSRSSISFDPEVTIEDGQRIALEVPLSRLGATTQSRGRSMREVLHQHELQRQLSRARSDTDREEYDPVTGERRSERQDGRRDHRYVEHQPRWPFLQSTVDDLAYSETYDRRDRSESPMADTAPPTTIEREEETPASLRPAHGLAPIAVSSSPDGQRHADWSGPSSAPTPRRLASRSMSYSNERRSLRRQSRRSNSNSASSPASAFLSRYFSQSPTVQLDGEGQEVGEYVLGREIGFGGFSTIREASTIENGQKVVRAVKIVRRQLAGRDELENEALQADYEREVEIWRSLSHDHILPLYAVYVTEFATFAITHLNTGGTLFDAIRHDRRGLKPRLCRRYAYQVASAIRYLHEDMHIVHRDVKLENCLIDVSRPEAAALGGSILLCDFGLADYMAEDDRGPERAQSPTGLHGGGYEHVIGPSDVSTNFTGSLPYASPEMINAGRPILLPQSDVWAFGVVCFAIITGRLPFQHSFSPRVRMMILNGEYDKAMLKAREEGCLTPEEMEKYGNTPGEPAVGSNGGPPTSSGKENGTTANPPLELIGSTELVKRCLKRDLKGRWDIRDCLSSRWLEPEMDAAGSRPGWAT